MKYYEFLRIARKINSCLAISPLLFGSLGLERRLNRDLGADDIDILVPEYYLGVGWQSLVQLMEQLGYEMYDLHEHAFRKGGCSAAFASLESLKPFAGVEIVKIPEVTDDGATYLLLDLLDYQKVYEASSKDGYRVNTKEKKDGEKLALIALALENQYMADRKMKMFNKLVRDKIPQIIEQQGEVPNYRILDDDEYISHLESKLDEEVGEYHRDKNAEELADILEVVFTLADSIGCSREELMEIYRRKHDARGGFQDRIFLISKQ